MLSRPVAATALVLAASAAGFVAMPPSEAAATGSRGRPTHFAMTASADIGRVQQFQTPPPPENGAVGARVVCANRVGQRDAAAAVSIDLRGAGVEGVATAAWTSRAGGKTIASSRATIGSVEIVEPSIGTVTLTGIGSISQAWHGRHGFHRAGHATLDSIVLHPLSGDDVAYPVPRPGEAVTIEDAVRVGVGRSEGSRTSHGARSSLDAVTVRLLNETSTRFFLGHSQARIQGGVGSHLYGGIALPGSGHDASGPIGSPHDGEAVPCVGSGWERSGATVYGRSLSAAVFARRVGAYQRSGLDAGGRPSVVTTSAIRKVTIDGGLEIWGIHGQARSTWSTRHGYLLSSRGSIVRRVMLNGERVRLLGRDSVTVDGIAILKPHIVAREKGSIEVTPLRVVMLDGSGQVFDLGYVRATLRPSGL